MKSLFRNCARRYLKQKCLILPEVLYYTSLTIFVTMVTYCVPDLHDVKGFSNHFNGILIFANGASLYDPATV